MPRGSQDKQPFDSDDFQDFFDKFEADLFRYARYLTDSLADAEDIYQDTWLRVAATLNRGIRIVNMKTFLFTVATNVHRDELKKRKVRRFFLGRSLDDNTIWVTSELNSDSFELNEALQHALQRLSPRQRRMFSLSHVEGFKISEISGMMNCAEGTVKATLYKAVQKLRQNLKEYRE